MSPPAPVLLLLFLLPRYLASTLLIAPLPTSVWGGGRRGTVRGRWRAVRRRRRSVCGRGSPVRRRVGWGRRSVGGRGAVRCTVTCSGKWGIACGVCTWATCKRASALRPSWCQHDHRQQGRSTTPLLLSNDTAPTRHRAAAGGRQGCGGGKLLLSLPLQQYYVVWLGTYLAWAGRSPAAAHSRTPGQRPPGEAARRQENDTGFTARYT